MRRNTSHTAALTQAIIHLLHAHGGLAWRQNAGALARVYRRADGTTGQSFVRIGERGMSDVIGLLAGVFIAIEVKTGRDALSDEQVAFLLNVIDCGGDALVARRIDDVLAYLAERPPRAAMRAAIVAEYERARRG